MDSESSKLRLKTLQACETCRALKIRCLPSHLSTHCQKCLKAQKPCIFAEQRPARPNRKRTSKSRVLELESKLEELIARVDQTKPTQNPDLRRFAQDEHVKAAEQNPLDGLVRQNSALSQVTEHDLTEPQLTPDEFSSKYENSSQYSTSSIVPESFFGRGLLSLDKASSFLLIFHEMSAYFPFVLLPPGATVQSMFWERPFLLLAVLAATSSREKSLQHVLEEELRTTLCTRVVIEGEKSLDLLQGLLVYLAWYHFHYIPRKQQSYQLLQMAIGMVVDLGLDRTPSEASALKAGLHLSHYQKGQLDDDFFSREARRAYVGCYYLSMTLDSFGTVFGKHNNMEFKDYMFQCCRSLEQDMETPTDATLLPLIKLQRLSEESHALMLLGQYETQTPMSLHRVQMQVKGFRSQLQEWESSLRPELQGSPILAMAHHSAKIDVHEMDLLNPFAPKDRNKSDDKPDEPSSTKSTIRVDILFICLEAAKDFFETFLSIPPTEYRRLSFIEWCRLIYASIILYKLSLGSPRIPEWDVQIARDTVRLEIYLEALCYRMQKVSTMNPGGIPESSDLFSIMKLIFENVKATYERLKRLPQEASARDTSQVHETMFPSKKSYQHRCPAFPYWSKQKDQGLPSPDQGSVPNEDAFPNDPFVGADLSDDYDFWGQMMAEAANGTDVRLSMGL